MTKLILLQTLGWKMASARNKFMGQRDTKGVGHAANTGRKAEEVIRKADYIHEKNRWKQIKIIKIPPKNQI